MSGKRVSRKKAAWEGLDAGRQATQLRLVAGAGPS
jgi:hypothetical protein